MLKAPEPIDLTQLPPEIGADFEAERAARLEAEKVAADCKESRHAAFHSETRLLE